MKNIIFGLSGYHLTEEERKLFIENPVSGFILFARNIGSYSQIIELTTELKSLYKTHVPKIFIDQEGGRVQRIKDNIISKNYPAAASLIDPSKTTEENIENVYQNYYSLMGELKELNIDSPCAPVCDIRYPFAHDIIGDRAFSDNAKFVSIYASAAIKAILTNGGLPFVKHIPGHGRAESDSHLELPIVKDELKTLEESDFDVFKTLSAQYKEEIWGMTAHVIYEALDDKNPATTSTKVINYIREEIGFKGMLLTDDLGMYALHGKVGQKHLAIKNIKSIIKEQRQDLQKKSLEGKESQIKSAFALMEIALDELPNILSQNEADVKREFINSLIDSRDKSFAAGCDYVLHCSGDYDEMLALLVS